MQKMQKIQIKRGDDLNTILEISLEIVKEIDKYMGREVSREKMMDYLNNIVCDNNKQIFKADDYAVVLKRKLGKKRLVVFDKAVKDIGYGRKD